MMAMIMFMWWKMTGQSVSISMSWKSVMIRCWSKEQKAGDKIICEGMKRGICTGSAVSYDKAE